MDKKDKTVSQEVPTQDERMSEESGSGSGSDEEGAGSDGMVVEVTTESDWVIFSSDCSISLIISLLTPFSTIVSLFITDLSSLNWLTVGRLMAKSLLIISQ